MLSIAGNLALEPTATSGRTRVTPGQLYRMLSADFRAQRPGRCMCRMPMVAPREPSHPGAANWGLEPARRCERCSPLLVRLAAQYAQLYDMG